jgi:hypothetical protein
MMPSMAGGEEILGRRGLNRALLERQFLLRRADVTVREVVERLVALQAQDTMSPYHGLWSRIQGFDPHELGRMLTDREAVRLTLLRGTVHLVTVPDALLIRPLVQGVIERSHSGAFRRRMAGADPGELERAVREMLDGEALGARELGRRLVARGIGSDAEAIGYATRVYAPLVQIPPRGVWGKTGQVRYATLEAWTGQQLEADPSIDALVLRYLAGFGPASVRDMQNWSGLTKLAEAFERLRPRLVTFRDEAGRELFDLPDAPRPDPDTAAPVRLLGEYDNVLLGHADRSRIVPEGYPWEVMLRHGRFVNNLLVDGMLRASWWIKRDGKRSATLGIRPFGELTNAEREEVAAEAERMLELVAPEAEAREVRFEPAEPRPAR